jgi:hypothetical protein
MMSSSEITFSDVPTGNTYKLSETISVPARQDEATLISFEVVVVPLDDSRVNDDDSQMQGQWLLWLIAVIYLALVLALYYGVYVALRIISYLGGQPSL